jgi:hypothetical protein
METGFALMVWMVVLVVACVLFCGVRSCLGRLLMVVVAGFALFMLVQGLLLSFAHLP